ncbi:MAG: histidine kinase dimerization/phospho-acceptor domain-containing protein [Paracoccaceae bacterium]|nr:histidine kinase dimerization/phospho-acceptor domain-containing protein [Paracoccaceae bacterium]
MLSFNLLVAVCLAYVVLLFLIAFAAERQAATGDRPWLRSPLVYTLSLSIYCTAWTFYGAVGYAARSGLEFLTIYLGPTIVMLAWWGLLRKLVRIGRTERITSIADLVSSRYGKSTLLGVLVTLIALIGTTPYIALQLQSVTLSFAVFTEGGAENLNATALWCAAGLALFTIVFGTRKLDVNERHHGVVAAIALEAVVKLFALLAVGIFVVFFVASGPGDIIGLIDASPIDVWDLQPERWMTLTFLAGAAFLCLPRMIHVMVVENADERHLTTASWAFPLYLFLMSLFVVPIAVVGLAMMPIGANPDLFVLTVPLALDRDGLAMLAFLGGFSSATSMVIVAAIAVSTMVSNHIVMPIWLRSARSGATVSGDLRQVVLVARRVTIAAVLLLGYLYYRLSGGGAALAAIGLISFAGVAQVLPALLGGIFWRGATRVGAAAGVIVGFTIWAWTLFLPSFGETGVIGAAVLAEGPWGIGGLRPYALFGIEGLDPVVHSVVWSMSFNTLAFLLGSFLSFPTPLERLQGASFVNALSPGRGARSWAVSAAGAEELLVMSQRIVGGRDAQALFEAEAADQGKEGYLPEVTPEFLERLERMLAGSVGGATAHAMVAQITGGASVSVDDLMKVADEAQQIMEQSARLEAQSAELGRTAQQLRVANEKLMSLSVQKDAFLSQISHELRTPMTSIRSFSEILRQSEGLAPEERQRYAGVIHDEALRLTRLLDDLLDLSVLENGQVTLNTREASLDAVISGALVAAGAEEQGLKVVRDAGAADIRIVTDPDRLSQVFINLISNARKYCDAEAPTLSIVTRDLGDRVIVDFIDNGSGVPGRAQELIFEKFSRLSDQKAAGSAGLGLAICREIMGRLGGSIRYLPGQGGGAFRVSIARAGLRAA